MHPEIADRKAEIAGICARYGVVRLEVFGSAARGTDFDPERSDADFAVEFERIEGLSLFGQYMGLLLALEEALGRPVDLLRPSAAGKQWLKEEVERSQELVHAARGGMDPGRAGRSERGEPEHHSRPGSAALVIRSGLSSPAADGGLGLITRVG